MSSAQRRTRRWWILGLGVAGLLGLLTVGVIGVLLPGVSVRSILRAEPIAAPCDPRAARVLLPFAGRAGRTWENGGRLPHARDEVRAVAAGDRVYVGTGLVARRGVLGGFASLDELYLFDPKSFTFEPVTKLPLALDHAALAFHRGALYVLGGWSNAIPTGRTFRLADGAESWEELSPMPTPRAAAAVAVVGDSIFVIGGSTSRHDLSHLDGVRTVEVFDTRTRRWHREPDMPTPRHHLAAAAVDARITVVGGRHGALFSLAQVEHLDTSTGRWTIGRPLPLAAGALTAATAGTHLVVTGGGDDAGAWVTPATWELAAKGRWRRLPDLQRPRHGHGMAAVGKTLYVFGGSPCAGYGRTDLVERLELR